MVGRTRNTMKNMSVMFIMQMVNVLTSFICRTFFVKLLPTEYLGLSGLFTNIIAVLSLSELGFGNVIIIHLYKPLAENDQEQICRLMNFYRKAYNAVGIFIAVCGFALTPFLDFLVKSEENIPYLKGYFLLFILQAATSYFFAYKRSILSASQQEYICSFIGQSIRVITNVLQILFLWLTHQYVAYLLVSIATGLCNNIVVSTIADKKFPFLKNGKKHKLDKSQTKNMFKNVSSMMLHKVGNTVINSTDNILISSMLGVIYTGLYSNYLLIMNVITQIITIGLNAVSASVGDFNARKTAVEKKELFDSLQLVSMWIFGMSSVCFACLFQPTISLWLGDQYLLDYSVVIVLCINFYINGQLRAPGTFSDINGIYVKTKFKPIFMAIINLTTSIICLKLLGLIGVFIGTLVSYILVGLWVDPLFVFKDVFQKPPIHYFIKFTIQTVIILLFGFITYSVVSLIPYYIGKVVVCVVLINLLLLLCYGWTKPFRFVLQRMKGLFRR